MNPKMVAQNRTARLTREAQTPVYSTDTLTAEVKRMQQTQRRAADLAMSEDWCHICGRPTDHRGEHTPEQIAAWAAKPGLLQSLLP